MTDLEILEALLSALYDLNGGMRTIKGPADGKTYYIIWYAEEYGPYHDIRTVYPDLQTICNEFRLDIEVKHDGP